MVNFIHKSLPKEEDLIKLVLHTNDTLECFVGKNCLDDSNGEDQKAYAYEKLGIKG